MKDCATDQGITAKPSRGGGIEVSDLSVAFDLPEGTADAVSGVSFHLGKGESVGMVGESGCGKTVTGLALLRLIRPPGRIISGRILLDGEDLLALPAGAMRRVRGRRIAMVFQDPSAALNPVIRIGTGIMEALALHRGMRGREARGEAVRLLEESGIRDASSRMDDYPHHFSGGMKQRAVIAAALAGEPEFLIADEPTTALDVTVQRMILDTIDELKNRRGMGLLLVTHDLGLAAERTRRIIVMYAGRIVEEGPTRSVMRSPLHPYTRVLLEALPSGRAHARRLPHIPGSVPSALNQPPGCRFHPRCPEAFDECGRVRPRMTVKGDRSAACLLLEGSKP